MAQAIAASKGDVVTVDGAEYHVTAVRDGGVYGHATNRCDEAGCSGDERYLATHVVECQCGEATGEKCAWAGPVSQTVVVEWMPEHLRASHRAAGNSGAYPANGALRIRVERSCAERLAGEE